MEIKKSEQKSNLLTKKLYDYGGHPVNVKGETKLKLLLNNFAVPHVFNVVCSKQNNLCGRYLMT